MKDKIEILENLDSTDSSSSKKAFNSCFDSGSTRKRYDGMESKMSPVSTKGGSNDIIISSVSKDTDDNNSHTLEKDIIQSSASEDYPATKKAGTIKSSISDTMDNGIDAEFKKERDKDVNHSPLKPKMTMEASSQPSSFTRLVDGTDYDTKQKGELQSVGDQNYIDDEKCAGQEDNEYMGRLGVASNEDNNTGSSENNTLDIMSPNTKVESRSLDVGELSNYELLRLRKIERNTERLVQLGLIGDDSSRLSCLKKPKKATTAVTPPILRREQPRRCSNFRFSYLDTLIPSAKNMIQQGEQGELGYQKKPLEGIRPRVEDSFSQGLKTEIRFRCDKCEACVRPSCGKCDACKDMPKFGGTNKIKQACQLRKCQNVFVKGDDISADEKSHNYIRQEKCSKCADSGGKNCIQRISLI